MVGTLLMVMCNEEILLCKIHKSKGCLSDLPAAAVFLNLSLFTSPQETERVYRDC